MKTSKTIGNLTLSLALAVGFACNSSRSNFSEPLFSQSKQSMLYNPEKEVFYLDKSTGEIRRDKIGNLMSPDMLYSGEREIFRIDENTGAIEKVLTEDSLSPNMLYNKDRMVFYLDKNTGEIISDRLENIIKGQQ